MSQAEAAAARQQAEPKQVEAGVEKPMETTGIQCVKICFTNVEPMVDVSPPERSKYLPVDQLLSL